MSDAITTPAEGAKPPAGFYDDGAGRQRWFDGTNWTDHYQSAPVAPAAPVQQVQSTGPMTSAGMNVKREVIYNRQQKGHSLLLHLFLIGPFTLWIPAIYYSVSPNHYWHA